MRVVILVAALMLAFPPEMRAQSSAEVEITEWPVPWENTRPRDPYVDNQGRVWFVGQTGDYLAYLEPGSGDFKRFDLEPGTGPHNLIVDEEGQVWYAGNRAAHIGRLDPTSGKIVKYPMPIPVAADPHTLVFDKEGNIWFTVQRGNFVGILRPKTGEIQLLRVATPRARPYGIVVDSQNRPWFVEFGSYKLATVDRDSFVIREIPLPREDARPRRLAAASDGSIWYVDYASGFLGRYDPASGSFQEWQVPGGSGARPYGMAIGSRNRLWFVETGLRPNRFVGFDPESKKFFSITPIPSGGGTVRHMVYHREGDEIWFGTDAGTIARARLPEHP